MNDPPDSDVLHPGHHSIRLKNFDYTNAGLYFVTICSWRRKCVFGGVTDSRMSSNRLGTIVQECWLQIPAHFPWITLLDFAVMPNHIHGIIEIGCQPGRSDAAPLQGGPFRPSVAPGSLGAIVRSFKSIVTKRARLELKLSGEVWQRNYFERVLRPGQELANASAYVLENPRKWEWDQDNPDRHKK
jgi:putative transposase